MKIQKDLFVESVLRSFNPMFSLMDGVDTSSFLNIGYLLKRDLGHQSFSDPFPKIKTETLFPVAIKLSLKHLTMPITPVKLL